MAHQRADSAARQTALDGMFRALEELEGVVTQAESRDARMTAADTVHTQEVRERFTAFGGTR